MGIRAGNRQPRGSQTKDRWEERLRWPYHGTRMHQGFGAERRSQEVYQYNPPFLADISSVTVFFWFKILFQEERYPLT